MDVCRIPLYCETGKKQRPTQNSAMERPSASELNPQSQETHKDQEKRLMRHRET